MNSKNCKVHYITDIKEYDNIEAAPFNKQSITVK